MKNRLSNLPTPSNDPTGFVAAITAFTAALFLAIDPAGNLLGRWQPVVQAGVILVSLAWARRHAHTPATVDGIIDVTKAITRAKLVDELTTLVPRETPPRKRAPRKKS